MNDYDLLRYAKQGIIIPVEHLIDKYMPNLKAILKNIRNTEQCVQLRTAYLFFPLDRTAGGRERSNSGDWEYSVYQ